MKIPCRDVQAALKPESWVSCSMGRFCNMLQGAQINRVSAGILVKLHTKNLPDVLINNISPWWWQNTYIGFSPKWICSFKWLIFRRQNWQRSIQAESSPYSCLLKRPQIPYLCIFSVLMLLQMSCIHHNLEHIFCSNINTGRIGPLHPAPHSLSSPISFPFPFNVLCSD